MHRERAVGGAQARQDLEERLQPLRHPARHHARRDLLGAGLVARHRQDEGARAPRATIALAQQLVDLRQRELALARNAERQRIASLRLVIRASAQGHAVVALRALLLADQIIGQTAVGGETARIGAQPLGLGEMAQRVAGPLG